ncbi:hypothetical protein RFI_12133, partial [Reticulomyxa filosa]
MVSRKISYKIGKHGQVRSNHTSKTVFECDELHKKSVIKRDEHMTMRNEMKFYCTYKSESMVVLSIFKLYFMKLFGDIGKRSWYKQLGIKHGSEIQHVIIYFVKDSRDLMALEVLEYVDKNSMMKWMERDKLPQSNQSLNMVVCDKDMSSMVLTHQHPYYVPILLKSIYVRTDTIDNVCLTMERLIDYFSPLSEHDKLLCIASEFPNGIPLTQFKDYYLHLYNRPFEHTVLSWLHKQEQEKEKEGDGGGSQCPESTPSLAQPCQPILSIQHLSNYFQMYSSNILLCQTTEQPSLHDFLLLPNSYQ